MNTFIILCLRKLLVIHRIFKYSVSIFVTLLVIFLTNPFITSSVVNQNLPADLLHNTTSQGPSYFRNIDLFSELSRNMTASSPPMSSDLFENETTTEEDGANSIIEGGSEEEETIIDLNETSSSELPESQSPFGLLDEENMETEKGQVQDENVQNDADVSTEEDEAAVSEVPRQGEDDDESGDNTINNDLTNST